MKPREVSGQLVKTRPHNPTGCGARSPPWAGQLQPGSHCPRHPTTPTSGRFPVHGLRLLSSEAKMSVTDTPTGRRIRRLGCPVEKHPHLQY